MMTSITRWGLKAACIEAARWPDWTVSVNISARDLAADTFATDVVDALDHAEIPPELETESSRTVIDYDRVSIGGTDYLLPSAASVEMTIRSGRLRNEMSLEDYRKFEANSTITFQP